MKNTFVRILKSIVFITLLSCENQEKPSDQNVEVSSEQNEPESVMITGNQFEVAGMEIGDMINFTFQENITVNGIIMVSSSGKAKVNTPIPGIIGNISVISGQYVNKGNLLFTLESKEIIDVQQDYAESMSLLKALEAEFNRQKILYEQKVISEKEFVTTESNFKSMKAKCSGLGAKLKLLNINPEKTVEGIFNSKVGIYSPINGYIASFNVVQGQYTDPQTTLLEIINTNQLILKLFVYEKDISYVKPGQKISFTKISDKTKKFDAEIITVGKTIHPENKAVECMAKISSEASNMFVNDTYVEALITVNQKESKAIPDKALIKSGNEYFIFVRTNVNSNDYEFKKVKVDVGLKSNNYSEILGDTMYKNVLIDGGYNLIP